MKKTISILITMMLVCVTIASISGAVELDGEINVGISQTLGLVAPRIELEENQTFAPLNVEVDGNSTFVNDTLSIKLNVTDDRENRMFPRFMLAMVLISRDLTDIPILPLLGLGFLGSGPGYLKRLIPVRMLPNPLTGEGIIDVSTEEYLNISMNYEISNDTVSENLTMHIFTIGFPMGDVNGYMGIKIIDHMQVNLKDVTYDIP